MKIIYFFLRRHCYQHDKRMFEYDAFLNKGWELEKWSAVNWTFEGIAKPLNIDEGEDCHYIDNESLLIENLERIKDQDCYFLIYPYDKTACSWIIRKNIKKYGFKFSNIAESLEISMATSEYSSKISFPVIFAIEFKKFVFSWLSFTKSIVLRRKTIFVDLKLVWLNFWGCLKYKSEYNFVTTPIYFYCFPNMYELYSKRNIMIHAESYDEALMCKKSERVIDKPYAVFIDESPASHSDFKKQGVNFPVMNFAAYEANLSYLFGKIEKDYNCEVVIAAHPKAEYKGDEFSGRKIISGKTNLLIKEAVLVVIEYSTCFGVLALLEKSFINTYDSVFFTNLPKLKNNYIAIEHMLHCKQLDIGNKEQVNNYKDYITNYNENYETFKEKYVLSKKSIGDGKFFYEVIEETIREHF